MNLTGKQYGNMKVLEDTGKSEVICLCLLCGKKKEVKRVSLKNYKKRNGGCGCKKADQARTNAEKTAEKYDLTGKTLGNVKVIERTEQKKGNERVYKCQCIRCGNTFFTSSGNLRKGKTDSCGCYKNELAAKNITADVVDGTKIGNISRRNKRIDNTSGVTGVAPCKSGWTSYISFQGHRYVLYCGVDKNEAIRRRKEAEEEIWGPFLEWYRNTYPERWKKLRKRRVLNE